MDISKLLTVVLLAACAAPFQSEPNAMQQQPAQTLPTQAEQQTALKRVWMLDQWPDFQRNTLHAAKAEVRLTALPHASAYMGCNRLMFSAEAVPATATQGSIAIGPVAATRMLCQGKMDLEMNFAAHIGSFTRYRIEGHRLILENPEGKTAVFIAQDWD